jgi:hypothetical protein
MKSKLWSRCAALLLLLWLSVPLASPAMPPQNSDCSSQASIEKWLHDGSYTFKTIGCQVWLVQNAISDLPNATILMGVEGKDFVAGVVMAKKVNLDTSQGMLLKLMQLSDDLEYVKVGIDKDGDLFLRAEVHRSDLTGPIFKRTMEEVVAGARQVDRALKGKS